MSVRASEREKNGGLTAQEENARRDAVMHGRHQPADVEPAKPFLACDLRRDPERPELLPGD